MDNLVIVGVGDLYNRFVEHALKYMVDKKELNVLATIDIKDKPKDSLDCPHILRKSNEKLSVILAPLKQFNPLVFLGHPNNLHLSDAKDLLSNGFKVLIEKPYAINNQELKELPLLIEKYPEKIVLLDYYLKRKAIPLMILGGIIDKDSFYLNESDIWEKDTSLSNIKELYSTFDEIIGKPNLVYIGLLEGAEDSAKVEHRGEHIINWEKGGGMIQDLGLHASALLFALEPYIGKIDKTFSNGTVKIAREKGYIVSAQQKYNLSLDKLGETYAEIKLQTDKSADIIIKIGKYLQNNPVEKKMLIKGDKGELNMDFYTNTFSIKSKSSKIKKTYVLNNNKNMRYYPVIQSAIKLFSSNPPLSSNLKNILLSAQELVISINHKAKNLKNIGIYENGQNHHQIFGVKNEIKP
ncbi:MAG: hypothetical protein AABX11_04905 [Nanoarchaeota archaeon]